MSADIEKIVEIGARAACKARKVDPDYCTLGSSFISSNGFATSECYRRAWQDAAMELYPAILGILAGGFAIVPREPTEKMLAASAAVPAMQEVESAVALAAVHGFNLQWPNDGGNGSPIERSYRAMVEAFSPVKG